MSYQIRHLLGKLRKKLPVLLFDGLSIPLAWVAAYWLRYNLQPVAYAELSSDHLKALLLVFIVQTGSYYYFKIYRGLWQYASLRDVLRIIRSAVTATVLAIPLLYLTSLLHLVPRSIFPLYCIVLISCLCSSRLIARIYFDRKMSQATELDTQRVLIVGAGRAGESLARDLFRHKEYKPVGFVDDSQNKQDFEVHGIKVLGTIRDIVRIVEQERIQLIFIALPSANSALMRHIVKYCEDSGVPFRTLPSLPDLISGRVALSTLRPVRIEDLLGRDQVELEWNKISNGIQGKRVLVTGGGGSIGSELCRQIMLLRPSRLVILDNSEYNLYQIEQELKTRYPSADVAIALVSVTDKRAVHELFAQHRPEVVFHAAAYKHVPLLQNQVRVAVQNNVIGTQVVAAASVEHAVGKFILISTDKAVNPTNIMGTTKRVAEIYCQNLNQQVETQFITVRFGNVLGSTGSVVPLFQKQLEKGGPITVTHPDMERYFMTIPEASLLILQAMVNGSGGEIFVLDMGEPVKIRYLAEQMIRLAGKEPNVDIKIVYTGLRPGEKMYEELFHESEALIPTEHDKLFKAQFRRLDWDELSQALRMLQAGCETYQDDELIVLLKNLVPEYRLDAITIAD